MIPGRGSPRSSFHCERIEWSNVQIDLYSITTIEEGGRLFYYLKATPDYCVLLDVPVGGQGRWHSTDQCWLLESFNDSDWSSNQSHRRSTSCGIHVLNGVGSLRTQRVASLSSCEAELHAMVRLFVVETLSMFFTQTLHQVVNWLCAKALVR